MFILPIIVFPLILILTIRRLYQIPIGLWSGKLQVPAHRRVLRSIVNAVAYLALLGYSVALSVSIVRVVLFSPNRPLAYLPLLGYILGYPLVYFVAAWVFYHGLKPVGPRVMGGVQE